MKGYIRSHLGFFILSLLSSFCLFFSTNSSANNPCAYLALDAGASFALSPRLNVPPPWDPSPNGYNAKFRNSEVWGGGLGYYFCPGLSSEIMVNYRNEFKYTKSQTSSSPLGSKTRYFNLRNTTIMANVVGHGTGISEDFQYKAPYFCIDPFVSVGVGVSYNTLYNFHSLQSSGGRVFSIMQPYTQTTAVYQLGFGLEMSSCERFSLGLGYRFVDAGRFRTNDYIVDNPDAGITSGAPQPFWRGRLRANEIYLKLKLYF